MILDGVTVQKKELHCKECYVVIHQAYLKGQNPHEKGILLKELQIYKYGKRCIFLL